MVEKGDKVNCCNLNWNHFCWVGHFVGLELLLGSNFCRVESFVGLKLLSPFMGVDRRQGSWSRGGGAGGRRVFYVFASFTLTCLWVFLCVPLSRKQNWVGVSRKLMWWEIANVQSNCPEYPCKQSHKVARETWVARKSRRFPQLTICLW